MFKNQLVNRDGEPVTLKSTDRVRFEWSPTAVLISAFPDAGFQTYFFGTGAVRDDKHLIACTVPYDRFDTFCEANMALLSSFSRSPGFKRVKESAPMKNVRFYEIR